MDLDFSTLNNDQLIEMVHLACQEAAHRGLTEIAQSAIMEEAENARILRAAIARENERSVKERAAQMAKEAVEQARRDEEEAKKKEEADHIARTWEFKDRIGKEISDIFQPRCDINLKIWSNGADKRIYIGGGFDDNNITFYYTGNSKNKPKKMEIRLGNSHLYIKDDKDRNEINRQQVKDQLLPILEEVCSKWSNITIPVPEFREEAK